MRASFLAGFLAVMAMLSLATVPEARAASAVEIDADVDATLTRFFHQVGGAQDLVQRASGVLVFPSVVKAGMGVGGEYGEGALRIGGKTAAYYSAASGSIGLQLGAETRSVIIAFLTKESLSQFRAASGWTAGVDGSVALVNIGEGGTIDNNTVTGPVVYFVFDNAGLMFNLSIEGTKFTRIER